MAGLPAPVAGQGCLRVEAVPPGAARLAPGCLAGVGAMTFPESTAGVAPRELDREAFVRFWLGTYTRGDLAAAMACYCEDVYFEDPVFGERLEGRASLRAAFAQFFGSGVTALEFVGWTGGQEGGAAEWQWTARWGPGRTFLGFDCSNRRFVVRGMSALTFRDGLICRQVDLWDARGALRQLGVLA